MKKNNEIKFIEKQKHKALSERFKNPTSREMKTDKKRDVKYKEEVRVAPSPEKMLLLRSNRKLKHGYLAVYSGFKSNTDVVQGILQKELRKPDVLPVKDVSDQYEQPEIVKLPREQVAALLAMKYKSRHRFLWVMVQKMKRGKLSPRMIDVIFQIVEDIREFDRFYGKTPVGYKKSRNV